ncbi:cytochrome b [Brevundimonas sp. Root1279]|uniref:cytochrome b n=1 Tax=Brevundimonas sp. Root1279 TaxID=1736443 RepID=UPI0007004827|nr:cytochrome b [Brevundimonas sp. Root1279]KQW79767.1 cytochrome B [Brevundimonas sp. Root1279]
MAEPRNRYSAVSLILHWVIALAVVAQVLLIMAHDATEGQISREYVNLHKSVGLTILVLTLVRIGWRLANPAIPLPDHMPRWQKIFARVTHVGFYVMLLAMPLVGWAASSAAGRDILWFGLFQWPLLPIGGGREVARELMDIHELGAKVVYILIFLHLAGALKHQFVDRDNVLHRMIPFIPRRP